MDPQTHLQTIELIRRLQATIGEADAVLDRNSALFVDPPLPTQYNRIRSTLNDLQFNLDQMLEALSGTAPVAERLEHAKRDLRETFQALSETWNSLHLLATKKYVEDRMTDLGIDPLSSWVERWGSDASRAHAHLEDDWLGPEDRVMLLADYALNEPQQKIADIFGVGQSTVAARLSRAHRNLTYAVLTNRVTESCEEDEFQMAIPPGPPERQTRPVEAWWGGLLVARIGLSVLGKRDSDRSVQRERDWRLSRLLGVGTARRSRERLEVRLAREQKAHDELMKRLDQIRSMMAHPGRQEAIVLETEERTLTEQLHRHSSMIEELRRALGAREEETWPVSVVAAYIEFDRSVGYWHADDFFSRDRVSWSAADMRRPAREPAPTLKALLSSLGHVIPGSTSEGGDGEDSGGGER